MSSSASTVIREARTRAGMTQAQLADRAKVTQSVVSAYESAAREPSVEMVRKLVSAAGFDLTLTLDPQAAQSTRRASVDRNRLPLLRALRRLGATNVRLFGSVARGDDGPGSDIDLLVDLRHDIGMFGLGRMRTEAERILGSSVDIVPANGLKLDAVERVLAEAILL